MRREEALEEICDGRLYAANDMVRTDAGGCHGCSQCCQDMGETILVDPRDIYYLQQGLQERMESLLNSVIGLRVVDGVILPHIKMNDRKCCTFLKEGRCSIHAFRPGFCRLFPLGRYYHDETFSYILQKDQCPKQRSKIKIHKWLGIPDIEAYEQFCLSWHTTQKQVAAALAQLDFQEQKQLQAYFLQLFYMLAYDETKDFYEQFYSRHKQLQRVLKALEE